MNQGSAQQDMYGAAVKWHSSGCSVIPIAANGTKRPLELWKRNQSEQIHPDEWGGNKIDFWRRPPGIGLVCGKVSGNLEMLELEGRATSEETLMRIYHACARLGVGELWNHLHETLSVLSPSGGVHLIYRVTDHEVPGNTKVARRPATPGELAENPDDRIKVLAETRGEGGYFVAAPSGGTVHPTGLSWELLSGEIGVIPQISWADRQLLHQAIHVALDKMPEPQAPPTTPRTQSQTDLTRPGDAWAETVTWSDILVPHGWSIHHVAGQTTYWTRPGKSRRDGHSATTGHSPTGDRLYVFSSATGFDTETPYSKFHAYATLEHHGDHKAAARALGRLGYGDQPKQSSNVDRSIDLPTPPDEPAPSAGPTRPHFPTHVGNADRLLDQSGNDFRYVPATKEWMVWDGKRWRVDVGQAHITEATVLMTYLIQDEARRAGLDEPEGKALWRWFTQSQMDNGIKGTISQFSRKKQIVASPEDFDDNPGLLNLPNGVYNLDTHELLPHDRKYLATQVFGAAYDPSATAPQFRQLMEVLIPDAEMRTFVQRAVGYSLLGRPDQRAMFITHGPKRTGKSQFHNVLSLLFGDYAGTAQAGSFHRVDRRGDGATPGLHMLRNKRFVTTSEESEHAVLDTESLKRLTGNEAITTRALYQDGVRWRPQMVLWMATNPLPQLNSDDDAIWDRVKPIPFNTRFSARGDEGTIRETPGIAEKIFAEEASGIFNWALEGLRMFQAEEGLNQPEQVEQGVADYRHETDPASQFWTQMSETGQVSSDSESRIEYGVVYQAYVNWCQLSHEYALSSRRFGRRLRAISGVNDFVRSNGRYYVPGYKWIPTNGHLGTMGDPAT